MNNRIKNSIGLRHEMEKRGLGLNAGGTYVMASLDGDELDHLKIVNFAGVAWATEELVVEVKGTARSGTLVRFVNLSVDGRYCRFPGRFRYLSPKLLQADPVKKKDFVSSIAGNPTIRIKKTNDVERVGLLVGPRNAKYKSLISIHADDLIWTDIEENPPPQSSQATTVILEDNPALGDDMRRRIVALFTKPKISEEIVRHGETQLFEGSE
jgi:hypothetical protein